MLSAGLVDKILLKGLELVKWSFKTKAQYFRLWVKKKSHQEKCIRCESVSRSIYDRRNVTYRDVPLLDKPVTLHMEKRRFWCKQCKRVFTESTNGILKGHRTTERFKEAVFKDCQRFTNLSTVRKVHRCSSNFIYTNLYRNLERVQYARPKHWPRVLGIDEHYFKRSQKGSYREFATVFVSHRQREIIEVVEGRNKGHLCRTLHGIKGRNYVSNITMDLSETYRSFANEFFPNARIVADKFHVLRLLNPAINKYRKAITGDKRNLGVRRILLANRCNLEPWTRYALHRWLSHHPELSLVYTVKEALHSLYRVKGLKRAQRAFVKLTDFMATCSLPEIKTLRTTLLKWSKEILAYFEIPITNGITEGFNNKAKLIKRNAYGYRSFKNYRLRLLAATQKAG